MLFKTALLLLTGVKCIAEMLKGNKVLKVLEMGWNKINDDGMSAISKALKSNTSLVELSLIKSDLSPEGMCFARYLPA